VTTTTIAIGILALAGLAVLVLLLTNANRGRRSFEDVPPGMRPAYSDEQLERRVLERYMAWGVVLTLFFAVFFPVYWIAEDRRLNAEQDSFFVQDVVRGEQEYNDLCIECHGAGGVGGAAPSPYGEGAWPAPNLTNIVARYADNPNITDIRQFIWDTLQHGRPGTPMPTFGAAYGGPLTDQQIDSLTDWILANQVDEELAQADTATNVSGEELYTQNCAKCHSEDLQGYEAGRPAPSLEQVLERHGEATILGILQNGIYVPSFGPMMPPWQNGYMYEDARFDDEALQRIIQYLAEETGFDLEGEDAPDDADGDANADADAGADAPDDADADAGAGADAPDDADAEVTADADGTRA
jgi:mono/diheme cytochrome c family protein